MCVCVLARALCAQKCIHKSSARPDRYYERQLGIDQSNFVQEEAAPRIDITQPIPPHTGFGTDEDSLGSFYSLVSAIRAHTQKLPPSPPLIHTHTALVPLHLSASLSLRHIHQHQPGQAHTHTLAGTHTHDRCRSRGARTSRSS